MYYQRMLLSVVPSVRRWMNSQFISFFIVSVWQGVMGWWDKFHLILPNLFVLWECWCGGERNKRIRKSLRVIWKARNDNSFNNRNFVVDEMVEDVKVLTWRWSSDRISMPPCMFYEWCWNPRECLTRLL